MGVNWGEALRIGGTGFATVFLVLAILAVAVLLIGLALKRTASGKDKQNNLQKGK
jgi:Na+-transporting methylmalonyl-CoA/oxaloacetate decarboxylase gamma subunit